MANNWQSVHLEGLIPEAIKQLAKTVGTVVDAYTTVLNIQVAALKLIAAITTDLLNAEALITKAAIATIEAALQPLLADAKLHVLVVPFRKQPNYRLDPRNPSLADLARSYAAAREGIPVGFVDSDDAQPVDIEAAKKEKALEERLRQAEFANGGNQGFLRTVGEAIADAGDHNRPVYDENSAIFAQVLLAGASDIVGIIDALLTLEGLFGLSLRSNNFVPRTLIRTPQDLTAKPIMAPSGQIGAMLEWANPPAEQLFPEFNNIRVRLHEIAVIKSTDDAAVKAKGWGDLFGDSQPGALGADVEDQELTNVLTSANSLSNVVLQFRYDGVRTTYLDDTDLQRNTDYYYAVAYRYAVKMPPGMVIPGATVIDGYSILDYKLISSVQSLRFDTVPESVGGVKPDWVATPSVLSLIPDLQFYVKVLQLYLASIKSKLGGSNAALLSYIAFLEDEIKRYKELADNVIGRINKLIGLLKTPAAGLYSTSIMLESGGSTAFLRELTTRLLDTEDSSAPPFHTGTEFVAGIVLLAGAPNFSQLSGVQTLLQLFFGTVGSTQTSFEQALSSLEQTISTETSKVLGS